MIPAVFWVVWASVALPAVLFFVFRAAWSELAEKEKYVDLDAKIMVAVAWPFVASMAIIVAVIFSIFHWGPRAIVRQIVKRRTLAAEREAAAKKSADERRYVVEQGPHR